jgi:hypothetical protein
MFVGAGILAALTAVGFAMKIEFYQKENPFEKDEGALSQPQMRCGLIMYACLLILNIGFGFWVTAIFWAVACTFTIASWGKYIGAYEKQFGGKENNNEENSEAGA